MTLRGFFGTVILFLLFVIYSLHVNGQQPARHKPHYKITPPTRPTTSKEAAIIAARDNHDGTVTIEIMACGSMIELIVDRQSIKDLDPEIDRIGTEAIEKACVKTTGL